MLVALQLQSFPAMAMLLCQDNLSTHITHQFYHIESHVNQQSDLSGSTCDDCIFCHISINFYTSLNSPLISINFNSTVFLFYIPHFYQFISKLPQRPPKNS
jgi:hypothetical protein